MISLRVKPAIAPPDRHAFTLLELMLVLALIVALAGLAYPSIISMFEAQRLYKAGDQIRAAWASARNDALSNGRTMLFRYTPQTDSYTIEPWQGAAADAQIESDSGDTTATTEVVYHQGHLPEGVVFHDSATEATSRSDLVETSDETTQDTTAKPIMFFPDGTTSTAQLQMTTQRGQLLTIELRGLTGISIVGEVTTATEQ